MKSEHLEEAYQHIKGYLNRSNNVSDSVNLLHQMCSNCENFCGVEEHDYVECRNTACFKLFLWAEYAEWVESFSSSSYMNGL